MTNLLGVLHDGPEGTAIVTFDRLYNTNIDDMWDALTDSTRLNSWFAKIDGDLTEGGHFTIHFDDGDAPNCHVLECAPKKHFVFEWPTPHETLVTVTLLPDGDRTRLELKHERLTPVQGPEYSAGWDAYLHTLDDHLGGGELRDWWSHFNDIRADYRAQLPL